MIVFVNSYVKKVSNNPFIAGFYFEPVSAIEQSAVGLVSEPHMIPLNYETVL